MPAQGHLLEPLLCLCSLFSFSLRGLAGTRAELLSGSSSPAPAGPCHVWLCHVQTSTIKEKGVPLSHSSCATWRTPSHPRKHFPGFQPGGSLCGAGGARGWSRGIRSARAALSTSLAGPGFPPRRGLCLSALLSRALCPSARSGVSPSALLPPARHCVRTPWWPPARPRSPGDVATDPVFSPVCFSLISQRFLEVPLLLSRTTPVTTWVQASFPDPTLLLTWARPGKAPSLHGPVSLPRKPFRHLAISQFDSLFPLLLSVFRRSWRFFAFVSESPLHFWAVVDFSWLPGLWLPCGRSWQLRVQTGTCRLAGSPPPLFLGMGPQPSSSFCSGSPACGPAPRASCSPCPRPSVRPGLPVVGRPPLRLACWGRGVGRSVSSAHRPGLTPPTACAARPGLRSGLHSVFLVSC